MDLRPFKQAEKAYYVYNLIFVPKRLLLSNKFEDCVTKYNSGICTLSRKMTSFRQSENVIVL